MIKSMTGYGKRFVETSIGQITIEVRAVNNRYIEVYPKLPDFLSAPLTAFPINSKINFMSNCIIGDFDFLLFGSFSLLLLIISFLGYKF